MTRSIAETVASFCLFALLIVAGISGGQAVAGDSSAAKRVLVVTGEDYPGHLWRQTTPVLVRATAEKRLSIAGQHAGEPQGGLPRWIWANTA